MQSAVVVETWTTHSQTRTCVVHTKREIRLPVVVVLGFRRRCLSSLLFCEFLLQRSSKVFEFTNLRSTYIFICVQDNFLCYTAIMLNIVTIQVIRKTSSLPTILKILIMIAPSDVGALGRPYYISLLVKWLQQSSAGCSIHKYEVKSDHRSKFFFGFESR